jgi:hypothetical protein
MLCKRYYQKLYGVKMWGYGATANAVGQCVTLPVEMRAANPTVTFANVGYGNAYQMTAEQRTSNQVSVYALVSSTGSASWITDMAIDAEW